MLPGDRHSQSPPTPRPARPVQVGKAGEAGGQEPRGPTEDWLPAVSSPRGLGPPGSLAYGGGAGGAGVSARPPPPREAQGRGP